MKKIASISLVLLLCLTLIPMAVSCGGGKAGLSSEEMEYLVMSEADVEELRDAMTAEEWDEFVEEVHEEYRMYKQAQPTAPKEEPKPKKMLEPIEMLPDRFPGFCPEPPPYKVTMRPVFEGMVAGAWGRYDPTVGGEFEDVVCGVQIVLREFDNNNTATTFFEKQVAEAKEVDLSMDMGEKETRIVINKSDDDALIAVGKKKYGGIGTTEQHRARPVKFRYDHLRVKGKYFILISEDTCYERKPLEPFPVPASALSAIDSAWRAIKF